MKEMSNASNKAGGFSKVVKCVPHPTPKGEKERGAAGARRATFFLSLRGGVGNTFDDLREAPSLV